MKVIALSSTYAASRLSEADVVISKLEQIQISPDRIRRT